MAQNNSLKFQKTKNVLDLEHQKYINYFNIFAISFITISFTIIWSFLSEKITSELLYTGLVIDISIFITILLIIRIRIKNIIIEIKSL